MKKELTISALALSLFSITPVSANTIRSSSDTSAPSVKDSVKASNLATKCSTKQISGKLNETSQTSQTSKKNINPEDAVCNLILRNKDNKSKKTIPMYYVGHTDFCDYYAFVKNNHPVIVVNEYVTHHHQKCLVMYYRNQEYYVPAKYDKQKTLSLDDDVASNFKFNFKQFDNENEIMQQMEKSKQTYEQYQKQQQDKDKLTAQNYYDLGKYLNQHPDQIVKSINVIIPNKQKVPDGFTDVMSYNQTLYLVGTQAQLDQAFNDVRNYRPNNQIDILNNNSQVAIFDSAYHQIANPSDLYTTGEKIQLNNQVIDRNTLENQMVRDYHHRPEVYHVD